MENEPTLEFVGSIHSITMYKTPDGIWVISDSESGVTTQGETKYTALIMLADALAGLDGADIDLEAKAVDILHIDDDGFPDLE